MRTAPWYDVAAGRRLVTAFIVLTLFAVTASVDASSGRPWSLDRPIPLDVYLFGFLGAMARSLLVFVTDLDPRTDDEAILERSWIETMRLGLRLFGALCLAAGVHLVSGALDDAIAVGTAPPVPLLAGTAFVAGFYVERAYDALGRVADRLLSLTGSDSEDAESDADEEPDAPESPRSLASFVLLPPQRRPDQPRWYEDRRSQALLLVGLAVTVLAMVVTIDTELLPFLPELQKPVPVDVYLYALLGALGYVFTTMFAEFDKGVLSLLQKGLRIPAALLLAAGFYMFTFLFVASDSGGPPAGMIAGLSFLVGLYVNVALVSLDEIATRLFSRFEREERRSQ